MAESLDQGDRRPTVEVPIPEAPGPSSLVLSVGDKRIRLGESEKDLYAALPRPRGAFEFFEAPPINSDELRSRGWESNQQTLALLSRQGRVVLALITLDNVTADAVREALATAESENGAPDSVLPGEYTNYRFWNRNGETLMVCETTNSRGVRYLTMAVGNTDLMAALRMSEASATGDQADALRILRENSTQS